MVAEELGIDPEDIEVQFAPEPSIPTRCGKPTRDRRRRTDLRPGRRRCGGRPGCVSRGPAGVREHGRIQASVFGTRDHGAAKLHGLGARWPASLHRMEAVVRDGRPVAWDHRIVQESIFERVLSPMLQEVMPAALPLRLSA